MDIDEKDKYEPENRNENSINYQEPVLSSDWQFGGANLTSAGTSLVPSGNPLAIGSSCNSALVAGSFGSTPWEHPSNSQNLGFCGINVQNGASSSNAMGIGKDTLASLRSSIDRPVDMGWNATSSMLKGSFLLPNMTGILPQSLSQLPADSAFNFIERVSMFSSFNGGSFSDMVSPFGMPESTSLYTRGVGLMSGPEDMFIVNGMKSVSGVESQKSKLNVTEATRDACLLVKNKAKESQIENERKGESLVRANEGTKQGNGSSGNESDEAEFSGCDGGQDEPSSFDGTGVEPFAKGLSSKKRKKSLQDVEIDQAKGGRSPIEAAKDSAENKQKGDQKQTTTINKTTGKQGSPASHPPKEEYIHVRARRGQATNSHSLAERVRREKISERMKFLQDLVPGCSKVTGKAVMLDEIINYVQSLQRQVEFLSMKLATVNPRLDFNIEGLLAKDGVSPDLSVGYPSLHLSQPGLVQAALPVMGNNAADVMCRSLTSHLTSMTTGLKLPNQLSNAWEDELHNVVQMNYGTSAPSNNLNVNESQPSSNSKVEL